ncbi:MAG: Imm1 family immunity protein [Gloeotrichia echinulata IR180]
MTTEKWLGNKNEGDVIENPNWSQIEKAIRELDGESQTLITLGINEDSYMSIGGGTNQYVVTVTFDNLDFYILIDSTKSEQIQTLVVGGQRGNYPANQCVDLLRCLLAARTFTESGKLDELLTWEQDKSLAFV